MATKGKAGQSTSKAAAKKPAAKKVVSNEKGDRRVTTPGRRAVDLPEQRTWQHRFHIYARENWYRDVWMIALTIVVVITVAKSLDTSNQAKQAVARVQEERKYYLLQNCLNQNQRHDATINALQAVYKHPILPLKLTRSNSQIIAAIEVLNKAERQSGRAPTILLINAIVPHQDCTQLVKRVIAGS